MSFLKKYIQKNLKHKDSYDAVDPKVIFSFQELVDFNTIWIDKACKTLWITEQTVFDGKAWYWSWIIINENTANKIFDKKFVKSHLSTSYKKSILFNWCQLI